VSTPVAGRLARVPVAILDPRERAPREGLIERIACGPRRVEITLMLDDGAGAEACLEPHEVEWLELRAGDIVAVRPLDARPRCDGPARPALSLNA
jgi:hypothetical protein